MSPLRGMIAPASLKLASDSIPLPLTSSTTPGHDCPGLIEADTSPTSEISAEDATPGHDCPGLIEAPARRGASPPVAGPLRGMIAPASLKPTNGTYC